MSEISGIANAVDLCISEELKVPLQNGRHVDDEFFLESIPGLQQSIEYEQMKLFQRLRNQNDLCSGALLLRQRPGDPLSSAGKYEAGQVGEGEDHIIPRGTNTIFLCQSCQSAIVWIGVRKPPSIPRQDPPWEATKS